MAGALLTERGLGLLYAGLIACSIAIALLIMTTYLPELYALGLFCGAIAAAIFTFMLALAGIIFIVAGREEYGGAHSRSVLLGLGLIFIAVLLPAGDYMLDASFAREMIVYARIMTVSHISGMMIVVGLGLLVHNLLSSGYKKLLWLGVLVGAGSATFGAAFIYNFISGRVLDAVDDEVASYQLMARLVTGFYVAAMPIFVPCVARALRRVRYEEISPKDPTRHGSKFLEREWLPEYTKTGKIDAIPAKFDVKPYNALIEKEDNVAVKIEGVRANTTEPLPEREDKMETPTKIATCPECGALLMTGQQFCGSCGKLIFPNKEAKGKI